MPEQPKLLWINKTSKSSSLSNSRDDDTQWAISNHVQRHVNKRSIGRQKRPIPYTPRSLTWTKIDNDECMNANFDSQLAGPIGRGHPTQPQYLSHNVQSPTGQISILNGKVDSFASTGVRLTTGVLQQLQYFNEVWMKSAFRSLPNRTDVEHGTDSLVSQIMHDACQQDAALYALLAATSMRMKVVHGEPEMKAPNDAQQHASRALVGLRHQLAASKAMNPQLAICALFLAGYEVYCYNIQGTRAHLRALHLTGAENSLRGYTRNLAWRIDLFTSAASLSPPVLKVTHEHFSQLADMQTIPMTEFNARTPTIGCAFSKHRDLMGQDMSEVVQEIVQCARSEHGQSTTSEFAEKLFSWTELLSYKMLCCVDTTALDSGRPTGALLKALVISLLMWLSYLPSGFARQESTPISSSSMRKIVPGRGSALMSCIQKMGFDAHNEEVDVVHLVLWISTIGTICAVDAEDVEFLARTFIQAGSRLQIRTLDQLQEHLSAFLWLDTFATVDHDALLELLPKESSSGTGILMQLLSADGREEALETLVSWAHVTKVAHEGEGKETFFRATNRPSNVYRLAA